MAACVSRTGWAGRAAVHLAGERTGGRFALLEIEVARGEEWPCHLHHWEDETLYVLSGALTVYLDGQQVALAAGEAILLPRGVEHTYAVASEDGEARVLTLLTPSGFEGVYRELGEIPMGAGVERLVAMAARYGCEITGPPDRSDHRVTAEEGPASS